MQETRQQPVNVPIKKNITEQWSVMSKNHPVNNCFYSIDNWSCHKHCQVTGVWFVPTS